MQESLAIVVFDRHISHPIEVRDRYKNDYALATGQELANTLILLTVLPDNMKDMEEDLRGLISSYRTGLKLLGDFNEKAGLVACARQLYKQLGLEDGEMNIEPVDLDKLNKAISFISKRD